MPKGIPRKPKIDAKCPPILRQLIEQEGSGIAAARKIKAGVYTIQKIAKAIIPMSDKMRAKIEAGLDGVPRETASPFAPKPEPVIPAWNKKVMTIKIKQNNGKTKTYKNIPTEFVELVERNGGSYNAAAQAIAYSGWNPIRTHIEKKQYEEKIHPLVYRALNGLPINRKGQDNNNAGDNYTLGLAVCMVSLSEYERLEDIAAVLDGHTVFKMSAGSTGWIVIYRMRSRDKLETFKRLAQRDAKKIVCP